MQVLLGISHVGSVQHTELLTSLAPKQMLSLARDRWSHFFRIEVWEEAVCILRLPPSPLGTGRPSTS